MTPEKPKRNCGDSEGSTHWQGCYYHEAAWQKRADQLLEEIEGLKLRAQAATELLSWELLQHYVNVRDEKDAREMARAKIEGWCSELKRKLKAQGEKK